jgi:hypothetical protein
MEGEGQRRKRRGGEGKRLQDEDTKREPRHPKGV